MGSIAPRMVKLKNGEAAIIRTSIPSDAARFVEIMRAVAQERAYTIAEPDELDWTEHGKRGDIEAHLDKPGYLALSAEVDGAVRGEIRGNVVGFLEFENGRRRRTAHSGLFSIFIAKGWRGQGIGRALIEALLDWAAANPLIEKVTLATFSTNTSALALYEKIGFEVEGRCPRDMKIDGEYVDSVLMYRFVK
jgi:RimJ/RimL family protein N-acetyltransferase